MHLVEVGRLNEAVAAYDRELQAGRGDNAALLNRAVALSQLRRFTEAERAFEDPRLARDETATSMLSRLRARKTAEQPDMIFVPTDVTERGLMWVLCTNAFDERFELTFRGDRFIKIGMAQAMLNRLDSVMDGDGDELGVLYSVGEGELFRLVEGLSLSSRHLANNERILGLSMAYVHVEGSGYPLYTTVMRTPDSLGFVWRHVDTGKTKTFAANDHVPSNYGPITTLRTYGVDGYGDEHAVPQLNSRGADAFHNTLGQQTRLRGHRLADNPWIEAVVLVETARLRSLRVAESSVTFLGDGRYVINPSGSDAESRQIQFVELAEGGRLMVDPFQQGAWNCRAEELGRQRWPTVQGR